MAAISIAYQHVWSTSCTDLGVDDVFVRVGVCHYWTFSARRLASLQCFSVWRSSCRQFCHAPFIHTQRWNWSCIAKNVAWQKRRMAVCGASIQKRLTNLPDHMGIKLEYIILQNCSTSFTTGEYSTETATDRPSCWKLELWEFIIGQWLIYQCMACHSLMQVKWVMPLHSI